MGGIETLYNAVKTTYGPMSGNVGIINLGAPLITHDGATVANSISIRSDERIGVELIKLAAKSMDNKMGDGTTTVTVLTRHILEEADNRVALGQNPMRLRRQLEADAKLALAELKKRTIAVKDKLDVVNVATISSGDPEIGGVIAEAVWLVGADGSVVVEEDDLPRIDYELSEGYTIDTGFINNYMAKNADRSEVELLDPKIILAGKLDSREQLATILAPLGDGVKTTPLLIVADTVAPDVMSLLVQGIMNGNLNATVIESPGFGARAATLTKDLEAVIGEGGAERVVVSKTHTVFIKPKGDPSARIKELKAELKHLEGFEKEVMQRRIAALGSKVATIRIGGENYLEVTEKRHRIDDAVNAARAALKGGYVPGGGVTLLDIGTALPEGSLLGYGLQQPIRVLLENSGYGGLKPDIGDGKGINVVNDIGVKPMVEQGVIDPAQAIQNAIENAVSVAGVAMTMNAIVVEVEDD